MSEYICLIRDEDDYHTTFTKREEIVRCRDCKMFDPKEGAMLACKFEIAGFTQWRLAEPDGFCKWGERKTDELEHR